jgi:hypothetical protein
MLKASRLIFSKIFLFGILIAFAGASHAQELQIQFPQEGQQVRGEITVRYTGVPDGGNVNVKLDGNWIMSNAQGSFPLNTFDLKSLSPSLPNEGTHKLTLTAINSGGKRVDEKTVSFEVANTRVDTSGEGVLLAHYEDWMRLDPNVQRYRVFAESNGMVDDGQSKGGGGGAAGGAGGGEGGGEDWIPAPLDWQVSALMRRVVRDVGGWSDTKLTPDKSDDITSANIKTVVQEAFQRQRESESGSGEGGEGGAGAMGGATGAGGAGRSSKKKKKGGGPTKAPWNKDWELAPEVGQYFVKAIEPTGREINATRKAPTIALADLLPTFPDAEVHPGSTWETRMTFLGDLSSREPVNVSVPITFTSFENVQTPAGFNRRAAKLESRFQMPELVAKKMAINLILQGGVGGGGSGGGASGGETGAGGEGMTGSSGAKTAATMSPEELQDMLDAIPSISSRASRVLWFDVQNHRVLRSEDTIRTFFSYEGSSGDEGGGAGGGGAGGAMGGTGGGESKPAEPTKVSYTLVVTTWYDDTVPIVHPKYVGGAGTAHSRDNVKEPSIEKISKPVAP